MPHAEPAPRLRIVAAAVGIGAALAAAGIGTAMLQHAPAPRAAAGPTAERITVSKPSDGIPLTDPRILDLLGQPPDLGPLADPQRRASCLAVSAIRRPRPSSAREPVAVGGRSGVLVLLAGDAPRTVNAVVVGLNCSSVDTGLLAKRVVTRP